MQYQTHAADVLARPVVLAVDDGVLQGLCDFDVWSGRRAGQQQGCPDLLRHRHMWDYASFKALRSFLGGAKSLPGFCHPARDGVASACGSLRDPIETQTQGHLLRVANVQELRIEKEKGCNQFTNGNVRVLSRRRGQRLHGTFTRTKNERQTRRLG